MSIYNYYAGRATSDFCIALDRLKVGNLRDYAHKTKRSFSRIVSKYYAHRFPSI